MYFSSDVEKPSWQIDMVSSNNVLTTDIYTIRLEGIDNSKISSKLNKSDISFLVGNNAYNPVLMKLTNVFTKENKVVYDLKIHMLKGEGRLSLKINNGTLVDDNNNESEETLLDTGITISKNNDTRILIWQDWNNDIRNNLSLYYSNMTIDTNASIDVNEVIKKNYDIVIYYNPYWNATTGLNILYNNGVNIISQYNNYTSGLIINNDALNHRDGDTVAYLYKSSDAFFTNNYFDNSIIEVDDVIRLWHFNSNATVLYKTEYDDEVFDKIGYLKENNNTWFNIGINNFINYVPIIEFIMGKIED